MELTIRDADGVVRRFLLERCGESGDERGSYERLLKVPVERVATFSTTEIGFFEVLGSVDNLVAHAGLEYVSSPEIRRRVGAGKIVDLGLSSEPSLEHLLQVEPDVILSAGDQRLEGLARLEHGPVEIPIHSYLESSALGRAEWILPIAVLVGREAVALRWFRELEERYAELVTRLAELSRSPRVMTGAPVAGVWWVPTRESFVSGLIREARGTSVWDRFEGDGAIPLDLEVALIRAMEAEVWLQPGSFESIEELGDLFPEMARLPPISTREVWANDLRRTPSGGNDYWESGVVRPEVVLEDFARILHPEEIKGELAYHRRLPARMTGPRAEDGS